MEIMNDSVFLQESYFGKDDTLLECENCIKAMKEAITIGKNPNSIPEKTALDSLLAKKFNCEKIYVNVIADESCLNAFTVPFIYEKNYRYTDEFFELISDNSGIKYKNPSGKILYIYLFTYTIRNCSVDSIMGTLLHEIGHNFYLVKEQIQNKRAKNFTALVMEAMKIMNYYENTQYRDQINAEILRIIMNASLDYKNGIQQSSYDSVKKLMTDKAMDIANEKSKANLKGLQKIFFNLKIAFKSLKTGFKFIKNSLVYMIMAPTLISSVNSDKALAKNFSKEKTYAAEKFADNFAISYGYGKETAMDFITSFENSTYVSKAISKLPLVRFMTYYNQTYMHLVKYMAEGHPTDQKRVVFALEKLKYELANNKKDLSPKQIAEIEKDIVDIETAIKNTPKFKKSVNKIFATLDNERDKVAMGDTIDEDIYDFDKRIVNDKITNESLEISNLITENYESAIDDYYNAPVIEILNESYNLEQ